MPVIRSPDLWEDFWHLTRRNKSFHQIVYNRSTSLLDAAPTILINETNKCTRSLILLCGSNGCRNPISCTQISRLVIFASQHTAMPTDEQIGLKFGIKWYFAFAEPRRLHCMYPIYTAPTALLLCDFCCYVAIVMIMNISALCAHLLRRYLANDFRFGLSSNANIRDYVIVRSQLYRKTLAKTLLKVIVLAVGARHCQHAY